MAETTTDPNALYYTFSTIAQTLAGAFGILAAFALYGLTELSRQISHAQEVVRNLSSPFEPAWATFAEKGVDEYLRAEVPTSNIPSEDLRIFVLRRGEAALRSAFTLRRTLATALLFTVADIIGSIILIPFVPNIAGLPLFWRSVVLAVTVGAAVACLVLYAELVWGIVAPLRRERGR